ncbi:MAG: phosphotransferase [Gemmatimonadota bacterium]|nr:phosphotransferase [Gemmatimonadota bacterium]
MALSLDHSLPDPEWLKRKYEILWDGRYHAMSGRIAHVVRIACGNTGKSHVLRVSAPARNSEGSLSLVRRLSQVHRFQTHLNDRGVRTVLPLSSFDGKTFSVTERGMTVEVFPFVEGRPPTRGIESDVRLAGSEIARLHNAGVGYRDLPDEESLCMNHLAIDSLVEDVRKMRVSTRRKPYHDQFIEYVASMERCAEAIDRLRPHLVETGLHLDTGPRNMIIDREGQLWFIDCNHGSRGRRVFEVCVSMYYLAPQADLPWGEPARYRLVDEGVEAAFLKAYRKVCEPPWRGEKSAALAIERMLMFIHGVTCWTTMGDEEEVRDELDRWNACYSTLKTGLEGAA